LSTATLRAGIERRDEPILDEADAALGEGREDRGRGVGRRRDGRAERHHDGNLGRVAAAARDQEVMQEERSLARRRRTLEGRAAHADDGRAALEPGQDLAQLLGAGNRVELVAALDQARRGRWIDVGAEGHDQGIGFEGALVGLDAFGDGVDRAHRRLHEPDARLDDLAIGVARAGRHLVPEHHVELREAEDERIGPVDQHEVDRIAQGIERIEVSSSPPKPAPRTTTRVRMGASYQFLQRPTSRAFAPAGSNVGGTRPPRPVPCLEPAMNHPVRALLAVLALSVFPVPGRAAPMPAGSASAGRTILPTIPRRSPTTRSSRLSSGGRKSPQPRTPPPSA
jgi:hypothetical protein